MQWSDLLAIDDPLLPHMMVAPPPHTEPARTELTYLRVAWQCDHRMGMRGAQGVQCGEGSEMIVGILRGGTSKLRRTPGMHE
eukprot:10069617-Alexandrium_andersonii.AAC.1